MEDDDTFVLETSNVIRNSIFDLFSWFLAEGS